MNKTIKTIFKIIFVIAVLVFVYYMSLYVAEDETVGILVSKYGYIGLLVISVLSGFNLLIPVPAIIFLPIFLSAGLNFWISVGIIVVGMTAGDAMGFVLGRLGKDLIKEHKRPKWFPKVEKSILKYPKLTPVVLFLYAALVPLPNEILVVPLAFFGVRFRYIIISVFLGNLVFNTISGISYVSIFSLLKIGV